jgi:HK97 gp10 family phage protein
MPGVIPLLEFVAMLPAIERDIQAAGPKIIERACQIVQKRAKANIGREHDDWAPLAPSTIKDKSAHGFPTPKPLLRTGELRDSIEYTVNGNEGWVGSDLDKAAWMEFGTSRVPPRPFLGPAVYASEDKIRRLAAAGFIAALSGHGHNAHDLHTMLRLLHKADRALHELARDLLEDDEEEKKR